MKFIDEFRDRKLATRLMDRINNIKIDPCGLMEVCGTHTVAIFRYGLRDLLPEGVRLISGPGCPVCVTSQDDIDRIIAISEIKGVIVASFGDMLKVPGTSSSLEKEKAKGRDIRVVYSPRDSLDIARKNENREVVFLGIGFETTAPTIASCILEAKEEGLKNITFLVSHKLIPPAMRALMEMGEVRIDGFICPGHVSAIIGSNPYRDIAEGYNVPCVVSGFEPLDMLQSILMLLMQIENNEHKVEIGYIRAVHSDGNRLAQKVMDNVFEVSNAKWRGLGLIRNSGLRLRGEFAGFDALLRFEPNIEESREHPACRCGEVLRGIIEPSQCKLFRKRCTPERPYGPCMVSSEGTCATYYKYR